MMNESNESNESTVCKYEVVAKPIEEKENTQPEEVIEIIAEPIAESTGHLIPSQINAVETYSKILEIEKDTHSIKYLCIIDFFLNIMYFILYYYQFIIYAIFLFIGYGGASKRNPSRIKCYMIYQSSQIGIKTMGLLFLLSLKVNTKKRIQLRIEYPNNNISGNIDLIIFFTIITVLFNINFLCFLRKYYNLLPLLKQDPNYIVL